MRRPTRTGPVGSCGLGGPSLLNPLRALFAAPLLRRIGFHARRIGGQMDRHFFTSLLTAIIGFVVLTAVVVTLLEEDKRTFAGFGSSFYWAITTVIGSGDASYVTSPGGFIVGWLLAFFGVAIVAAMTGAVVGFVIDFLLKEGQGMGAAGLRRPHRRLRLERDRPRSDRGAARRRVRDQGRAPARQRAQPRRRWACTSCAATSPAPMTSTRCGIRGGELAPSSSRPIGRTRPTCARSWR